MASRTRARRSTNLQLRESANESDLHPVSPMFLDVEAIIYRVRPPICVRTKAMLDTRSSLSFMSTRLYDKLPKRIMEPAAFQAQLADGSEMPFNHCCQLVLKFLNGSHPLMTLTIQVCVLHLPPQVDILLGAPFHRSHKVQVDWVRGLWVRGLVIFPKKRGRRPSFPHCPPQYIWTKFASVRPRLPEGHSSRRPGICLRCV